MSASFGKKLKERVAANKGMRATFETHWEDVAKYVVPNKDDITSTSIAGEKKGIQLFDSTALHANELLAGALHGMLTNPTSPWFSLSTGNKKIDEQDQVRLWLQDSVIRMNNVLDNSNFQTEIHEVYLDLGSFGTSAMEILEDDEKVVRFHTRFIAKIFIEENNKGLVDTVYREFDWTPRQIAQEFGEEALTPKLKSLYKSNSQEKCCILHAVLPMNEVPQDIQSKIKGVKQKKFASLYFLDKDDFLISADGFREFPYVVPRWSKISGESYGRSPAMKVLPDTQMINAMMKTTLKAGQKSVDPPIALPDDGFILPLNLRPGGVNYYRAGTGDKFDLFGNSVRVDFGFQLIEVIKKQIRQGFFVDQLQLGTEGPQMTATEVAQRNEERLRLMGPILGRQQVELLGPLVDRVFAIMFRKGLFLTPPEMLEGKELQVRYSSLFSRAQRATEGNNILRTIEAAAPFINADPEVLDNIDGDVAVKYIGKIYGMPEELYKTQEQVQSVRKIRAEARMKASQMDQQSQQAEQLQKAGAGVAGLAKVG